MRASSDAMLDGGIADGDLLLWTASSSRSMGTWSSPSSSPSSSAGGSVTHDGLCLRASDPAVVNILPGEGDDLQVWGVVTTVVKSVEACTRWSTSTNMYVSCERVFRPALVDYPVVVLQQGRRLHCCFFWALAQQAGRGKTLTIEIMSSQAD